MEIVVILHNIRSLHNVGSIFRTADAAGVKKIYLCGITPAPVDVFGKPRPQLTKVSLGAEKYIEWEKVKSTAPLITQLKKDDCKIFAIEQSRKSIPYNKVLSSKYKVLRKNKVALVLGNEVKGLSPSILKRADKILEIPMNPPHKQVMWGVKCKKESLNVAVAFGVVVFHLRQC